MDQRFGRKHRNHQAQIAVSARGPGFTPVLEENGRFMRPRFTADLRYTTADVEFLHGFWRDPWDPGKTTRSFRSQEPTVRDFWRDVEDACSWLADFIGAADWIGGGLNLTFAGHGRDSDGALVLADGAVSAEEFVNRIAELWMRLPKNAGCLRLAVRLDSCYSGSFLLRWLEGIYGSSDALVPYFSHVSSMPDEVSWEESTLGHGIFTYCTSHRTNLAALGAEAVQPDNTWGPATRLSAGEFGCARLTVGEQNPIRYTEYDELEILGRTVALNDLLPVPTTDEMARRLTEVRDDIQPLFKILEPTFTMNGRFSDAEAREGVQRDLDFFEETKHLT